MSQEKYQPSPEEIRKAEEMMTDEQKEMSRQRIEELRQEMRERMENKQKELKDKLEKILNIKEAEVSVYDPSAFSVDREGNFQGHVYGLQIDRLKGKISNSDLEIAVAKLCQQEGLDVYSLPIKRGAGEFTTIFVKERNQNQYNRIYYTAPVFGDRAKGAIYANGFGANPEACFEWRGKTYTLSGELFDEDNPESVKKLVELNKFTGEYTDEKK